MDYLLCGERKTRTCIQVSLSCLLKWPEWIQLDSLKARDKQLSKNAAAHVLSETPELRSTNGNGFTPDSSVAGASSMLPEEGVVPLFTHLVFCCTERMRLVGVTLSPQGWVPSS